MRLGSITLMATETEVPTAASLSVALATSEWLPGAGVKENE